MPTKSEIIDRFYVLADDWSPPIRYQKKAQIWFEIAHHQLGSCVPEASFVYDDRQTALILEKMIEQQRTDECLFDARALREQLDRIEKAIAAPASKEGA